MAQAGSVEALYGIGVLFSVMLLDAAFPGHGVCTRGSAATRGYPREGDHLQIPAASLCKALSSLVLTPGTPAAWVSSTQWLPL